MADKKDDVIQQVTQGDNEYFSDLLADDEELNSIPAAKPKPTEEELRKNKDAEEARKRREAEAKAAKQTPPAEEPKKVEAQPAPTNIPVTAEKPKPEAEPAKDPKVEQVNKLGEQLIQFKQKYPDVDLAKLDGDKGFKRFVEGKLLGKKNFTQLYEEFDELRKELSGQSQQQAANSAVKAQASTGSPVSTANVGTDVFSEDELRRISEKLPFMSPKEAAKVEAKLKRSIDYYDNKK